MSWKTVTIAILVLAGQQTAQSANLSVNMTVGAITHEFYGNYSVDHLVGSYYGAADWPAFTTSLSGVDSITLKLSAPTGKVFDIAANSQSIGKIFSAGSTAWSAPGFTFGGVNKFLPGVFTLENLSGVAPPSVGIYAQASADRRQFTLGGSSTLYSSGELTFSALVFTIDTSALQSEVLPTFTFTPNNFGVYLQDVFSQSIANDPGASIRLISSVPEPTSILLFIVGALFIGRKVIMAKRINELGA